MNTNESIKQAMQAWYGPRGGVVAYCFTGTGNQSLALLDVEFFPIQRYWFIVHRKNKRLSATAQAFKQFVLDEGKAKQVG